jgi:membrane protein EpsK
MVQVVDNVDAGVEHPSQEITASRDAKTYFTKNIASHIFLLIFSTVTSIYFVPYQKFHLGIENYGIVYLATQVVSWADIIALGVTGTIARFVAVNLAKGNWTLAKSYFNTQYAAVVGFCLVLLPVAAIVSYFTPVLFDIHGGQEMNARLLFFLTYLMFMIGMFFAIFQVGMFVRQRLYIKNLLAVVNQTVGYLVWIICFSVAAPSMWYIGFGRVIGILAAQIGAMVSLKKLVPEIKPSLREFDPKKLVETMKMGTWLTVGRIGDLIAISFDAVIINAMMGKEDLGRYGLIAPLAGMLKMLVWMTWSVMGMSTLAYAAKNDMAGLVRTASRAVKFLSLTLSILLGVFCGMSAPLLSWWLGPDCRSLSMLVWVLFCHLAVTEGLEPLWNLNYALNKLAVPNVVTVFAGIFKLSLAIILIRYTRLGLLGVAVADMVSLVAKNAIFGPLYAGRILGRSSWPFYKNAMPSVPIYVIVAFTAWKMSVTTNLTNFFSLAGACFAMVAVFAAIAYIFILNKDDKLFIYQVSPWGKRRESNQLS